jgi:hypothetical protein
LIYICLFDKVLNLEYISIRTVFYYLHEKYDNYISMSLSHFKKLLRKIDSIDISFSL